MKSYIIHLMCIPTHAEWPRQITVKIIRGGKRVWNAIPNLLGKSIRPVGFCRNADQQKEQAFLLHRLIINLEAPRGTAPPTSCWAQGRNGDPWLACTSELIAAMNHWMIELITYSVYWIEISLINIVKRYRVNGVFPPWDANSKWN